MMRSSAVFAHAEPAGSASSSTQAMSVVTVFAVRIERARRANATKGGGSRSCVPQRVLGGKVAAQAGELGSPRWRREPGTGMAPADQPARLAGAPRPEARWGERALDRGARVATQLRARGIVVEQPLDRAGERTRVARGDLHEARTGGGDLDRPVLALAADRGDAGRHRLDVGDAERLLDAGKDEQV